MARSKHPPGPSMTLGNMRGPLIAMALLLGSCPFVALAADEGKDAAYYCGDEFSGGVFYNATSKRWESTKFRVSDKFVLRLKFLKSRIDDRLGIEEKVIDYNVTLTTAGTDYSAPCKNYPETIITVGEWSSLLRCHVNLSEFVFSLKTNRYLRAYLQGYVGGEDNDDNTPHIAGGTCTKIN